MKNTFAHYVFGPARRSGWSVAAAFSAQGQRQSASRLRCLSGVLSTLVSQSIALVVAKRRLRKWALVGAVLGVAAYVIQFPKYQQGSFELITHGMDWPTVHKVVGLKPGIYVSLPYYVDDSGINAEIYTEYGFDFGDRNYKGWIIGRQNVVVSFLDNRVTNVEIGRIELGHHLRKVLGKLGAPDVSAKYVPSGR
jgi:hypothetical protein